MWGFGVSCGELSIAVLKKTGRGIILGQDLTVRHSLNISIGDQAMLCLLPVVPEIKE